MDAAASRSTRGGKREVEAAADAELAADPDLAAVCGHDAFRNWKSKSGALVVGALGTPVAVEHTRQVFLPDAGTGVGHRKENVFRSSLDAHHHGRRADLDGVRRQIGEDLHHAIGVTVDVWHRLDDLETKLRAAFGRHGLKR